MPLPLPFRRQPAEPARDPAATTEGSVEPGSSSPSSGDSSLSRGKTPSKRELGKVTPRRQAIRRTPEPPPANRREAYRRMRDKDRAERAERRQAMADGDERYLLRRDKGPERALVRNIVDSRFTVGTWFFAGALIVLIGSSAAMPDQIRLAANVLWVTLAAATIIDSILISRRIKRLVGGRFPKTTERFGSLYFYGVMRGITFRRMRMPRPKVKLGETV